LLVVLSGVDEKVKRVVSQVQTHCLPDFLEVA
jgi:hypothetical protein